MLCKLDLELALEGSRALGEDVEDQAVAIKHACFERQLEVSFLPGPQRLVDEDELGVRLAHARGKLVDLSAADEILGIGPISPRLDLADDARAGRFRQRAELLRLVVETRSV
jgi:hypothetical protein